ncbi:hypothetical protein HKW97_24385 (plasmid) [Pseudomonas luteola]|uniref:hypothetical protein n=1 Tax=Pseudomonas luteola TaxID=47886 RepID=UPI00388D8840
MTRYANQLIISLMIVTSSLLSSSAFSADHDICKSYTGPKSFISHWIGDNTGIDILTTLNADDLTKEDGKAHEAGDLNGDGNNDYIFESYPSQGSSGERSYNILIQCRGFLANAGGDYFSGFKLDRNQSKLARGEYKRIVFLTYKRSGDGNIIYHGKTPESELQVWQYDKEQKTYRQAREPH